jgi:hypothetical protein
MSFFERVLVAATLLLFSIGAIAAEQEICLANGVPSGWIVESVHQNYILCGSSPTGQPLAANIVQYNNLPVGAQLDVCANPVPAGWVLIKNYTDFVKCGSSLFGSVNAMLIRHDSCVNQSSASCYPPTPSGSIYASPASVTIPYGQANGLTKISYTTANTNGSPVCIWAGNNGNTPTVWRCEGAAASNLEWPYVPVGGSSKFVLAMSNTAPTPVLATVTVTGTAGAPTSFTLKPAYNLVSTGPNSANVLIPATASPTSGPFGFQWNAPGYDALDLQGQVNNGPWQSPVWIAPSGTNGDNIPLGTTYNYRLYPHGATTPLLATLSVTGIAAPAPTFSINPAHVIVPLNATTGSFTYAWNAPGYETLDLVGQVVTNGVAGPWGSPVWIAASGNNGDNIPVGTTYNYRFYPHGDSVHVIGTLSVTASR